MDDHAAMEGAARCSGLPLATLNTYAGSLMLLRSSGVLLLAGLGAVLSGQTLPWYLIDHLPARSATGVPTNATVVLTLQRAILDQTYPAGLQYTLKNQAGANVALKPAAGYYDTSGIVPLSVTPTAALAPATRLHDKAHGNLAGWPLGRWLAPDGSYRCRLGQGTMRLPVCQ